MIFKERQLRILGVLENVSDACDFVVEQAREAGLDERGIHHVYLAVDEAVTNIIEHGYGRQCEACTIDLVCRWDEHALTIIVVDDSPAFDPLQRPDPDPKAPLSDRGKGGWGIFFIKKLMDSVTYSYEDRQNRLVMVKQISKSAQTSRTREMPVLKPVEVTALADHVWLVTPSGRLDEAQARNLTSLLASQLEQGHHLLILNLADIELISSAGLKMLVRAWQRIRDQKGDLVLAALKPRVREVLEMIGLDLVFAISDTPDQARAYLASKTH